MIRRNIILFVVGIVFSGIEIYFVTHFESKIVIPLNGTIVVLWIVSEIRSRRGLNDTN